MKKSELLEKELTDLRKEQEEKVEKMVFFEGHSAEDHEKDWANYWNTYGREYHRKETQLSRDIAKEQNREIEVEDGVTICLYSDRHAATVIRKTKTTITVRRDKAIRDPNFKPEFIPGGFCAHCTNQDEQTYTYERDPQGNVSTFYWSEKFGRWQRESITLMPGRHEFYDYNF